MDKKLIETIQERLLKLDLDHQSYIGERFLIVVSIDGLSEDPYLELDYLGEALHDAGLVMMDPSIGGFSIRCSVTTIEDCRGSR